MQKGWRYDSAACALSIADLAAFSSSIPFTCGSTFAYTDNERCIRRCFAFCTGHTLDILADSSQVPLKQWDRRAL